MKKTATALLLAGAILLVSAGMASASSHGVAPVGLSTAEMVRWELQHFMLHMSLTYQSLQLMLVSPSLGWTMLDDQTLCATVSPLVGVIFGSAVTAVATFVAMLLVSSFLLWSALCALLLAIHQRKDILREAF